MKAAAVILAAGSGTRFGRDKMLVDLRGKPLWRWSFDAFRRHPQIDSVGIVCSADNYSAIHAESDGAEFVVIGGAVRQESSATAAERAPADADVVLIHDAARPLVSQAVISSVIDGVLRAGAAAPGLPVTDTVKEVRPRSVRTLDRRNLVTVQTPQGATRDLLLRAHREAKEVYTDELGLVESIGVRPEIVSGDRRNIKVTTADDIERIEALLGPPETRSGIGYDVHRFSTDPERPLMLGGERFEGPGLDGHSDADVLIHAVVDALLGAAGLGDIGRHFPDTEPRWKGEPSLTFLTTAKEKLTTNGWTVRNVDVTVIAETPRVMPHGEAVRANLARALGLETGRINIKATTNETMERSAGAKVSRPSPWRRSPSVLEVNEIMDVLVRNAEGNVSKNDREYAAQKLGKLSRYFHQANRVEMVHRAEKTNHRIEITVFADGFTIRGEEHDESLRAAIDKVSDKLENRLKRLKGRIIRNIRHRGQVLPPAYEDEDLENLDGAITIRERKVFLLKPMSAEEAALQMEMLEHPFFVFKNRDSGSVEVLYKRKDGNYGLLQPEV